MVFRTRSAHRYLPISAVDAGELFDRCWKLVWPIAYTILRDRSRAEDAAQEAIVRVFSSRDRFDPSRPLEPWVRKIAVNAALNQLRTKPNELLLPTDELTRLTVPASAHGLGDSDLSGRVRAAIDELSPDKRAVVVLFYWLDYPLREIAAALDLPVGTAASHLARAREQLRNALTEDHVRLP